MKKLLVSIGSFFTLIGGRIFAFEPNIQEAYGIIEPPHSSIVEIMLDILKVAFIPVTLVVGLIVFISIRRKKKSEKSDRDEKN